MTKGEINAPSLFPLLKFFKFILVYFFVFNKMFKRLIMNWVGDLQQ